MPMKPNKYQEEAKKFINPELTGNDLLINGVMGLCGESGEVIDIVKKHLAQGHPLSKEKMVEELGDVAWYLAELATYLEVPLEEIFDKNIEKLSHRFPNGFSKEASLHRED